MDDSHFFLGGVSLMILSFFSAPASWGILTKVVKILASHTNRSLPVCHHWVDDFPSSKMGYGRTLPWVPFMTIHMGPHCQWQRVCVSFEQGSKGFRKHPCMFSSWNKNVSSFIRFCELSLSGLVFFYKNLVLVDSWTLKDMLIQISQEVLLKLLVLF